MAEENLIQTNIVANANFAPLIADLNKVTLALSGLQEKLNASNKMLANNVSVMNKAFAETLRSTGQFSTHFVSLTSDVDKFGQQLSKGQIKLGQFFNVYKQHINSSGGIIRDLAKQQVQLQNAILQPLGRNAEGLMQYNVHIPRGLDTVKNKTALVKQELQIMNKVIQEGAGQMINWGKNTQWAGRQLTVGLTVPMAAFGKAAADAFKQADEQLVRLTKVYGGVAAVSKSELAKIRKDVAATATELAKSYGTSYTETISLAADIAATGKQGNELLKSTQETTRLAVLGEVTKQDAMKATLSIQNTFKQNTDQLAESVNFLNAVENQTSTTLQDLIEAIPKAGPVIKGMGGSVKDLALYLTAMKEGGISATEGANALKSGLASLINPTKVATNMFKGFGIDLKGIVTKNAGNLTQTILDLQSALETLNPLQKQQALEQLFGKFQFARMNALFSNLGKQGSQTLQVLDLMKTSSQDLANIAGRELAQVTESASGKYKRAVEGLKADLAGIGDQFLTINTYLIKFIDGVIKVTQALPDPIKKALGFMGLLTAGLGPLVMMTGVLGNFFGYVIKGISHFKSFFKGAEGWKLLTPEILAANKAGTLAEQTFYSDAKAAAILNQSLQALIGSYKTLEQQIQAGVISTTVVPPTGAAGLMRQVNPASPYLSPKDTRSMSHLNPVAGMSSSQKLSQTMFGVVPGAPIVNAKIGKTPQMYMESDITRIQGVSAVGKVSTGIVAQEAAQWHAMTGALAMQSKAEIAKLKQEITATGTVTSEVSMAYETLLPKMNEITQKAAQASALIVEDLRVNKINAQEASAKIIALNAEIEQLMVQASQQVAKDLGRDINVTQVPLLNQPVVDPRTGKSNMKELLKKGRTRDLVNKVARGLGVKTYGAAYSIETTIPKRFATGNLVPGFGNQDTVPALLTPGEFVVRKDAVNSQTLPLLQALNGRGSNGPGYNDGSSGPLSGLHRGHLSNDLSAFLMYMDRSTNQRMIAGRGTGITGLEIAESIVSLKSRTGMHPMAIMNNLVKRMGGDPRYVEQLYHSILKDLTSPTNRNTIFGGAGASFENLAEKHLIILKNSKLPNGSNVYDELKRVKTIREGGKGKSIGLSLDDAKYGKGNALLDVNGKPIMRALLGTSSGFKGNIIQELLGFSLGPNPDKRGGSIESHGQRNTFLGMPFERTKTGWATFGTAERLFQEAMRSRMKFAPGAFRPIRRNNGGTIPRYGIGGVVGSLALSGLGYYGGQALGGMLGGSTGSMIGGFIGGSLGGFGGMGRSNSVNIGQRLGTSAEPISGMRQSIFAGTKFADSLAGSAVAGGRLSSTLAKLAIGVTRLNAGLAIGTAAAMGAYHIWKTHQEQLDRVHKSYGLTADSAAKLNLKYKDYNTTIKDTVNGLKAIQERGKLVYESMASSGTPLNLTIEQYKKLRSEVKNTMSAQIDMINKTKKSDLGTLATQLKEQFVNAGMSAQDAANKIYTAFQLSNKASYAGASTFGNAKFSSITNAKTSAISSLQTFGVATSKGDAVSQANALNNALTGIDAAINEINADSKGSLSNYEAQSKLQELINSKIKIQTNLSKAVIDQLAKQNPEIRKFANTQDTVLSLWQKIKLTAAGFAADLSTLNAKQTDALYAAQQGYIALFAVANAKSGGALYSQNNQLDAYKKKMDQLTKAAKGQSAAQAQTAQQRLKQLNKEIDAINKAADARKTALQQETQDQDALLQIQQAKLDYQQKLASGDMAGAAQSQLEIQRLTNQQQTTLSERAIDDKRNKDIAPLQSEIDKINAAQDAIAAAITAASEGLDTITGKYNNLKQKIEDVNIAFANYKTALDTGKGDLKALSEQLIAAAKAAGMKVPKASYTTSPDLVNGKPVTGTVTMSPQQLAASLFSSSNGTSIKATTVILNAEKVIAQQGETAQSAKHVGTQPGMNLDNSGKLVNSQQKADLAKMAGITQGGYFEYNGIIYVYKGFNKSTQLPDIVQWGRLDKSGNAVQGKAFGGLIRGAGTSTSDSIPAMLSNGEYIINAASAAKFGYSNLNKINKMAAGGAVSFNLPKQNNFAFANSGQSLSTGDTISIGEMTFNFNELPADPRQFGAQLMEGIKTGRGRLITSR